ncbi:erythromycin esterase family protein [Bacteroidales bacterium OttesenSCG-928-I14]|nr:erythromycin esterase family protein [Bacteroidales bacterium OttesenSCG-928-I14]
MVIQYLDSLVNVIDKENIKVWGIDSESHFVDIMAVQILLKKYFDEFPFPMEWNRLHESYRKKFINFRNDDAISPSIEEDIELMECIDSISNYVDYIVYQKGNNMDLKVIKQWIRNLNTQFSYAEEYDPKDIKKTTFTFRNRDYQMAENIIFITENMPEERLFVWCANFHATKDLSQTAHPTVPLLYYRYQSMGETLLNHYGEKMYSIGFADYSNKKEDSLEAEIKNRTKNNEEYAFIDFERLRFEDGYRNKTFKTSLFADKGKWLNIFDGYYYLEKQEKIILSYE